MSNDKRWRFAEAALDYSAEFSFAEALGAATGSISVLSIDEYGDHALAALDMRRRALQATLAPLKEIQQQKRSAADLPADDSSADARNQPGEGLPEEVTCLLTPPLALALARILLVQGVGDGVERPVESEDAVAEAVLSDGVDLVEALDNLRDEPEQVQLDVARELGLDDETLGLLKNIAETIGTLCRSRRGVGRAVREVVPEQLQGTQVVPAEGRVPRTRRVPCTIEGQDERVEVRNQRPTGIGDRVASLVETGDRGLDVVEQRDGLPDRTPELAVMGIVADAPIRDHGLALGDIPGGEQVGEQESGVRHGGTLAGTARTRRRAAAAEVLAQSRIVLDEIREVFELDAPDAQVLDGLRRLLVDVERPPVPRSWHLDRDPRPGDVPDVTTAEWPSVCQDRTTLTDHEGRHAYTCTRQMGHTGRHAAGDGRYVVAVWEQTVPEVLGAVEGAA